MKRYYRSANDPKRFKPLVTGHDDSPTASRYWVVTTTTYGEARIIRVTYRFEYAIDQANAWADEYRAAWVAANMKAA